jgi:hypothetical protein
VQFHFPEKKKAVGEDDSDSGPGASDRERAKKRKYWFGYYGWAKMGCSVHFFFPHFFPSFFLFFSDFLFLL